MEQNVNEFIPYIMGKRVNKSPANPEGWQRIKTKDIPINIPVVICLGGNSTVSDRFANSMAKSAQNLLGIVPEDNYVNVYSIHYGGKIGSTTAMFTEPELNDLIDNLFIPRLINTNGKKYPLLQSCKNMRNLNFLTHCYGNGILNELLNELSEKMLNDLQYNQNETQQILSQILEISYAPYTFNTTNRTQFRIISTNDKYLDIASLTQYKDLPKRNMGQLIVEDDCITLFTNSVISTENELADEENKQDEHPIATVGKNEDWSNKVSKRANEMSNFMAFLLSLGVTNSKQNCFSQTFEPLPKPKELQELLQNWLDKAENSTFEQEQSQLKKEYEQQSTTNKKEPQNYKLTF